MTKPRGTQGRKTTILAPAPSDPGGFSLTFTPFYRVTRLPFHSHFKVQATF